MNLTPGTLKNFAKKLTPYRDILLFIAAFVGLNLLWKLLVDGGMDDGVLSVLGCDITSWVHPLCVRTAEIAHHVLHGILGYSDHIIDGTTIYFPHSPVKLNVVWDCTGIKQIIIVSLLLMCCYGPLKKKLYYIPLAIVILYITNVIRITTTALIIKDGFPDWFISFNEWYNHKVWVSPEVSKMDFEIDWFQFFHKEVFNWIYYEGVVFVLWLVWQEAINVPFQRKKKKKEEQKN